MNLRPKCTQIKGQFDSNVDWMVNFAPFHRIGQGNNDNFPRRLSQRWKNDREPPKTMTRLRPIEKSNMTITVKWKRRKLNEPNEIHPNDVMCVAHTQTFGDIQFRSGDFQTFKTCGISMQWWRAKLSLVLCLLCAGTGNRCSGLFVGGYGEKSGFVEVAFPASTNDSKAPSIDNKSHTNAHEPT